MQHTQRATALALWIACALATACADDDAGRTPDALLPDSPDPTVDAGTRTDAALEAGQYDGGHYDGGNPALELTHGPMLGAATDRSVRVWVRGDGAGRFAVRWWKVDEADRSESAPLTEPVALDEQDDFTGVALLRDLEASTRYAYRIEVESAEDPARFIAVTDVLEFHTLPPEGESARIRFVVAADVESANVPGFSDIEAVSPDFVLMIGDNVYADGDGTRSESYRALYQTIWGGDQFRALFAVTPAFMIWDDHEIMENYWRGKDDRIYGIARPLYDLYQGSHNPEPLEPGELYYSFRAADIGFFVLDTRTHRDPNTDDDDENKSMLGTAQRQAFEEWLAEDDSRVHVIVSSVLFSTFSTTGLDAWRSFSTERDALYAVIAASNTANTFIVSGDQHWSAVLHLKRDQLDEYTLYEFQTTPLGSGERVAPDWQDETVMALDNQRNVFGVFDVDTRVDPPTLDFTMCAVNADCAPGDEPPPITTNNSHTTLPYSFHFQGSASGFVMLEE